MFMICCYVLILYFLLCFIFVFVSVFGMCCSLYMFFASDSLSFANDLSLVKNVNVVNILLLWLSV